MVGPMAPPGQTWTVLCVDDEPHILSSLKRTLRGAGYRVLTAASGELALDKLTQMLDGDAAEPVDVLVSDMRMPGIDGAQLLEEVHARWPALVRVLLTGHSNTDSAVAAINRGRILRYLRKPWDDAELLSTVHEGIERLMLERERARLEALALAQNQQLNALNSELEARVVERTHELQQANQRLQRNHLKTIKVFSNLLELRGDQLAGHGRRVADMARDIARGMLQTEEQSLQVFTAGLLHDIGLIGALDHLLAKPVARYADDEMQLYRSHAVVGEQSLLALDDMQPLLPMIRGHHERFDGTGFPDKLAGRTIPLGARILAVADAYDDLLHGQLVDSQLTPAEARAILAKGRGTQFCPEVLDAFISITQPQPPGAKVPSVRVHSSALEPGMVLSHDLVSNRGVLMLSAGHRFTASLIHRVCEFEQREGGHLQIHIQPRNPE